MSRRPGNSYSSDVIKRLLQALIESGPLGKTRLGGKAGINHEMCIKYVNFLMMLNWVKTVKVDGAEQLSITSEGIEHLRKLHGESTREGLDIVMSDANTSPQRLKGGDSDTQNRTLSQKHSQKGKQKKNIVIVDDDESSLIMYEAFIRHTSHDFILKTFSQPEQALKYLVNNPGSYDLVILDIRMPKMSGFRFYQALKAANPHAKVMFLSSLDAGPELPDIFPQVRPDQFIRKPVDRNEFIRTISEATS